MAGDAALPDFDPEVVVDLDLREALRAGTAPLGQILAAAGELAPGGVLHLRTTFQPQPLFGLLGQRGFLHHTQRFGEEDWSSWFWRPETPPIRREIPGDAARLDPAGSLDLRGHPAPQPLEIILEKVASAEEPFEVLLPFDPGLLRDLLMQQGWQSNVVQQGIDGVRIRIARHQPAPMPED